MEWNAKSICKQIFKKTHKNISCLGWIWRYVSKPLNERRSGGLGVSAQWQFIPFHHLPAYDTSSKPSWRGCTNTSFTNTENHDFNHPSIKFHPENICSTLTMAIWVVFSIYYPLHTKRKFATSFCQGVNFKVHKKLLVSLVPSRQECHFKRLGGPRSLIWQLP